MKTRPKNLSSAFPHSRIPDIEFDNRNPIDDEEFYAFLQKLKAYQAMLADTRDILLLSTKNDLFDLLLKPPAVEKK